MTPTPACRLDHARRRLDHSRRTASQSSEMGTIASRRLRPEPREPTRFPHVVHQRVTDPTGSSGIWSEALGRCEWEQDQPNLSPADSCAEQAQSASDCLAASHGHVWASRACVRRGTHTAHGCRIRCLHTRAWAGLVPSLGLTCAFVVTRAWTAWTLSLERLGLCWSNLTGAMSVVRTLRRSSFNFVL